MQTIIEDGVEFTYTEVKPGNVPKGRRKKAAYLQKIHCLEKEVPKSCHRNVLGALIYDPFEEPRSFDVEVIEVTSLSKEYEEEYESWKELKDFARDINLNLSSLDLSSEKKYNYSKEDREKFLKKD